MTNRLWLISAGAGIFLLTLFTYLPADRVLNLFRHEMPANIQWQQVSGPSLHPVFYKLSIRLSDQRSVLIESADVSISILPLLLGRLRLQFNLRPDEGDVSGIAILEQSGWQIPQIEGRLPMKTMSTLLPELQMTGPTGRIIFTGNTWAGEYHNLPATGNLEVNVEELQLGMLNTGRPLGNYSLQMQARQGEGVHGSINTISTDAQLSVQGELSLDPVANILRFKGQAWAPANAPDSIQGLLPLLGPFIDCRSHIQWQASL